MTTFGKTLPLFTRIDASTTADHSALLASDEVFYLFEYTSRKNYEYSSTNRLISNLKKNPSKRASNPPEYRYKVNAMRECAVLLGGAINHDWLRHGTLVPIPPSKVRDHPEFDNRIMWMCQNIPVDFPVDVREIVVQTQSTEKAHESDVRPTVADLLNIYTIDEAVVAPAPTQIAIVDDVLTVGTHFRAMHTKLSQRFPNVPIVGMFIARRIFANPFAGSDLAQF